MRICFLLESGAPPRLNPIVAEAMTLLEGRGIKGFSLYPEEALIRLDTLKVEADLYLLKSDTELALSLATALEGLGARVLNRASASALARNKVLAAVLLHRAGIPTPRSFMAAAPSRMEKELKSGPLIFKPHRGYHGAGIRIAEKAAAIPTDEVYPDLVFSQKYFPAARKDLKVFAIGEAVFGVRKPFSSGSYLVAGQPAFLSPEVEEIARRCGACFGLELYGLDLVENETGVFVVDVNYFPGYRGVPEAPRRLADHIIHRMREEG
ncbi:MAG: hypothetical protein WAQ98_31445 [Blastocatellia bacterium]